MYVVNHISNVIIIDVLIVKQKVICNQCGTQWIVCTIYERRSGFTKLNLAVNNLKNVHPGVLRTDTKSQ